MPSCAQRCNLAGRRWRPREPSPDEREQLSRIDATVARPRGLGAGLLLAGHRPNATVAPGSPPPVPGGPGLNVAGGIYVSASLKEEFGIAILEAMASGLVVVAPGRAARRRTSRTASRGSWPTPARRKPSRARRRRRPRPGRRARRGTAGRPPRQRLVTGRGSASTPWPRRSPPSTGTSPRDPPGHQPGLRLSPLPARHPGHGLASGRRPRRRGHRARHGRDRARVRLRAGAPPARARVEPGRHPRGGPAARRGRRASRVLRRHPASAPSRRWPSRRRPGATTCCGSRCQVAKEVAAVVDRVRPDHVLVDHLAFSARLALIAGGVRHADVVLGHPSALSVGSEVYGYPPAWPRRFRPDPDALGRTSTASVPGPGHLHRALERRPCTPSTRRRPRATTRSPRPATCCCSTTRRGPAPTRPHPLLPGTPSSGRRSAARHPTRGRRVARVRQRHPSSTSASAASCPCAPTCWADRRRAARARRPRRARQPDPPTRPTSGRVPDSWLVRRVLPQVTLLPAGGARRHPRWEQQRHRVVDAGVPMLVLPLSTDQFAAAAALEAVGVRRGPRPQRRDGGRHPGRGAAGCCPSTPPCGRGLDGLSHQLRSTPGAVRAREAMLAV